MARILTPDGELYELGVEPNKNDWLTDVMANSGTPLSDKDGIDFELTEREVDWWEAWYENECLINSTIKERDLEETCPCFYDETPDWDDAQRMYAEYLGIELPGEFPAYG